MSGQKSSGFSWLLIIPPVVFTILAGMFFWGMQQNDRDSLPSARQGGTVPSLTLTSLGELSGFTHDDLTTGDVKLVNFWASWCAPCRAEHAQIKTLASEGIEIYGINYKDEPSNAMRFLTQLSNPYKSVMADSSGRTALDWGLYGVPETFIISPSGIVVSRFAGPITPSILESTIRPAIEEARTR